MPASACTHSMPDYVQSVWWYQHRFWPTGGRLWKKSVLTILVLQCFDTVGGVTRTSGWLKNPCHLFIEILFCLNKWKKKTEEEPTDQMTVMGKSQIKSHRQISNHSVNRFKSFNQISNPIFFSNLLVTNLKSLIFVVNSTEFVH